VVSGDRQKQKGIAVLTAILVVAIATALAVNLLWGTSVDIQRTQSLLEQDQARLYDLGGEELAKYFLSDDNKTAGTGGGIDSYQEKWPTHIVRQFKEGVLEGWLLDQQGLFDLNGLVDSRTSKADPQAKEQFENLLMLLDLDAPIGQGAATELAEAAIDWIDPDELQSPDGAEDDYYTRLDPPYVPANFWFTSVSELQAVKGFTPEILSKLWPHVTALPPPPKASPGQPARWPLNVNTATDLVVASMVRGQTADSVQSVCPFELKPETGTKVCTDEFPAASDFSTTFLQETGVALPPTIPTGVSSNWFLLTVTTTIGTTRSTMYSLLERQDQVVRTRLRTFDAN
jgi:general secretion pathway protein K